MNANDTHVIPVTLYVVLSGARFRDEHREKQLETNLSAPAQMRDHPDIVDAICQNLDGDALKDALFIVDNIRENKMKIKWSSVNKWVVKYRNRHVCYLRVEQGSLKIGQISDILVTHVKSMTYDFENTKRLIEIIRNSMTDPHAVSFASS